jgi:hypothetical protein
MTHVVVVVVFPHIAVEEGTEVLHIFVSSGSVTYHYFEVPSIQPCVLWKHFSFAVVPHNILQRSGGKYNLQIWLQWVRQCFLEVTFTRVGCTTPQTQTTVVLVELKVRVPLVRELFPQDVVVKY